ncbi:hypothetical protein EVAR_36834_1 [Eumeta japonica]|uniref:Androglobin n=1 Tax=Eumeta variegata TaxID=151549 RepID=A0A4C1WBY0_EUMVA|nr:hypothetical protein EVAR_36834_1 [Eumeta japonica]
MNDNSQNEDISLSYECPFREFKDTELSIEYWGQNPGATIGSPAKDIKDSKDVKASVEFWIDEQKQPLPRSARRSLSRWVRAQELALDIWNAQVVVSEVEHQWESFTFSVGADGWRPKHHVYSPGTKPGGDCSTWVPGRCIWVNDLVPVDDSDCPLLPFAVVKRQQQTVVSGKKPANFASTRESAPLWPLLLCKALLKLAAPNADAEDCSTEELEDEQMSLLSIVHALTGALNITFPMEDSEKAWNEIISEVAMFAWKNGNGTKTDLKSAKGCKKPSNKDICIKLRATTYLRICDTRASTPYEAPGMTPGHEMDLIVFMARDLPLVKPPPEPEVPYWKKVRWVEWARKHGLYEPFECPRTRYLLCTGLLKLSYKPELLNVCSAQTKFIKGGMRSETTSHCGQDGRVCNPEDNRDWIPYHWVNIDCLWINSLLNWHTMVLSEAPILLGSRGLMMEAASQDCDWTRDSLWKIGTTFVNWIKCARSSTNIKEVDREFYDSYRPDLPWERDVVGHPRPFLHWMFRRALESHLRKKCCTLDFHTACLAFRRYLKDPVFGLPVSAADTRLKSSDFEEVHNFIGETDEKCLEESACDVFTKKHSVSMASDFSNGLVNSYETKVEAREKP